MQDLDNIGSLLRMCRESVPMTRLELAAEAYKEGRFQNVTLGDILNEIEYIETNSSWTFTGTNLRVFWGNIFVCLKGADPWALKHLEFTVLKQLPDIQHILAAGAQSVAPLLAQTIADMVYLLDVIRRRRNRFRVFTRFNATLRRVQMYGSSTSNSERTRQLLRTGLSEIEDAITKIDRSANQTALGMPSKILTSIKDQLTGKDLQISREDIERDILAIRQRVQDMRTRLEESANA